MEEHPFLSPLVIVFKKFIVLNGYNSPFQGTLSSYSLVLMILAMLKDLKKIFGTDFESIIGSNNNAHINLGRAFTMFLSCFGD